VKDVPMSEAPAYPPLSNSLHLQDDQDDDLLLASVLKKKRKARVSAKIRQKPVMNRHCNSACFDDNNNEGSHFRVTDDTATIT